MTLFRKVLLGTGAVLLVAAAVGLALPRHVHVERSVFVNASRATVFTIANSYTHFNKWSPWAALDPDAKYTYEGPVAGVGAKMSWIGDPATMGSGSQTITESRPWEMVRTAIDFGPQGQAVGTFSLTADGAGTMVTWGFDTDLGMNPVSRYFGRMFDGMIGGDFERGLGGLKKLAERLPRGDFSDLEVEVVRRTDEGQALRVLHTGSSSGLALTYDKVSAYLAAHGVETRGDAWEERVDDPTTVPEAELRTFIWVPIK